MKTKINFLNEKEIDEVFLRFQKINPLPVSELKAPNDFTFLLSVVLSAQATDKSVNAATKELFKIADTPEKMLSLGEKKIIEYICTIGLYRNKTKFIIGICERLIKDFNSKIPQTEEDLLSLPGVGRKTANVILNAVFNKPTMPVDTHILRISPRIGLSDGTTPDEVEKDLLKKIPAKYLKNAHHHLVLHGRYICKARKPLCEETEDIIVSKNYTNSTLSYEIKKCPIEDICKKNLLTK